MLSKFVNTIPPSPDEIAFSPCILEKPPSPIVPLNLSSILAP